MLSSDQRREKLESLLKRVQTNRPRPAATQPRAAQGPGVVPHAPPAAESRAPKPPPAGVKPLEIETDLVETDSTDSLLDLEFDAGIDASAGALIDAAPPRAEAKAPPAAAPQTRKPSAPPAGGLEEPATLVESLEVVTTPKPAATPARPAAAPSPKLAPPSAEPQAKKPAAPAEQLDDIVLDDEPEIEVSYGTEEALALQAELGYGEDEGEFSDSDTQITATDQLTLADMPYQPKPAAKAAPVELDNLPAPGPRDARLDEMNEPTVPVPLTARKTPAPPRGPVTPVPAVETPKPAELEAAAPVPLTQPSIREAPVPDRTKLRAKTVEDLSALAELSLIDEVAPVVPEKPPAAPPAPAQAEVAPAPPKPTEEVTRNVAFSAEAAAAAAKKASAPAPAPPAPAEPVVHGFAPAAIDAKAKVEAFAGAVPAPRPRTLGELIRLALNVGRK